MLGNGAENREMGIQVLAQGHDGRNIPTPVTVIRRGPDGYNVVVLKVVLLMLAEEVRLPPTHLVALIDQLVGSGYQRKTVYVIKLGRRQ